MPDTDPRLGIGLSLGVAALWALGSIAHAAAGRRLGAFGTLLWRSAFAPPLLFAAALAAGARWPTGAQAAWFAASGLIGVCAGDILHYRALVSLGPRRTVQFTTLAPVFGAGCGWLFLGERLGARELAGAALVLAASATAIWIERRALPTGTEPGRVSAAGVLSAIGGAAMMGGAAVMVRQAYRAGPAADPFAAAAIRVGAASGTFWLARLFFRPARGLGEMWRDRHAMVRVGVGVLVGPVLGMLMFVAALKHLEAGLVTTLVSLSPLFILPVVALRYRARIGLPAIAATVAAIGGVALISLR